MLREGLLVHGRAINRGGSIRSVRSNVFYAPLGLRFSCARFFCANKPCLRLPAFAGYLHPCSKKVARPRGRNTHLNATKIMRKTKRLVVLPKIIARKLLPMYLKESGTYVPAKPRLCQPQVLRYHAGAWERGSTALENCHYQTGLTFRGTAPQ